MDVKEASILHKYMTTAGNLINLEDPGKCLLPWISLTIRFALQKP